MNITYTPITPDDAEELISYFNTVGGESDNLSFGGGEFVISVENEKKFIERINNTPRSLFLIAKDGEKIVGQVNIGGLPRRMSHIAELSITVLKEYWGQGIGTELMNRAVSFAEKQGFDMIKLEVRSDNERAIRLYRKTGFEKTGTYPGYFKVDGKEYDTDVMFLRLG